VSSAKTPYKILFVCMGNICRSPAAEAVFLQFIEDKKVSHLFEVDSAGTGAWHAGNKADPRSTAEGNSRGYSLESRARQVNSDDFSHYDDIICMDDDNYQNLIAMGSPPENTHLLLKWHSDTDLTQVPDPYYGGQNGFVLMYDLIEEACMGLLDDRLN